MGQKWGWVCCPSILSREREAGLGVLGGLESIHRPWGQHTATLWWLWSKLLGNIPGHMGKQSLSWSCRAVFSKCIRVRNHASRLQYFPLVQCFPWCFPQLLPDTISSFYIWQLRRQSSSLYLDAWLPLSRANCLYSRLCSQHSALGTS